MSTRSAGWRRRRLSVHFFLISSAVFTGLGLLILTLRSIDPSTDLPIKNTAIQIVKKDENLSGMIDRRLNKSEEAKVKKDVKNCATVEEMGEIFSKGYREESLRVRRIIQNHFALNGASRVRGLPPDQFCRHGFVIGKASEAGLGNEMYKILTAAALSVMLNRSLIIGQTRHIGVNTLLGTTSPIPTFPSP